VVATHPIQYQSAWFRRLAAHPRLDLKVFFCHRASPDDQSAAGFGVRFDWDVPLTDGFAHEFLKNLSRRPGVDRFGGLDTPGIRGRILRGRFDGVLVDGWYTRSSWQAIRACWDSRTPLLVRGDSHLHTPRSRFKRAAKELLYPRFITRFDACLAVGRWSADYFLHYGARPDRVFFVPHSIDEARFAPSLSDPAPLRSVWGLDAESLLFLFVGKLIPKKRPADFVEAVCLARSRGARVQGLVVGDGPQRAACERRARSDTGSVRFAGFVNQSRLPEIYAAADALVLPSDGGETWGLVVNESMACERPCIVSDRVGCGPDLIVPGRTGFLFPMADRSELAALLASRTREELRAMGARARLRLAGYSNQAAVEGVVAALDAIHGAGRRVSHA
jgi:glycosyltransferase involved in cell wall biosynthesis